MLRQPCLCLPATPTTLLPHYFTNSSSFHRRTGTKANSDASDGRTSLSSRQSAIVTAVDRLFFFEFAAEHNDLGQTAGRTKFGRAGRNFGLLRKVPYFSSFCRFDLSLSDKRRNNITVEYIDVTLRCARHGAAICALLFPIYWCAAHSADPLVRPSAPLSGTSITAHHRGKIAALDLRVLRSSGAVFFSLRNYGCNGEKPAVD